MRRSSTLLFFLVALAPCFASFLSVDPTTGNIVDSFGRVRLFHGVNVVYKLAPFHPILDKFDPELSLCDSDMENLAKWGFNVVRLGVMWEAVEPTRGQYNTTYLGIMRGIVDRLGSYGIYTIIDSHQDNMNGMFCGEGFPQWAIDAGSARHGALIQFPFPLPFDLEVDARGYPNISLCQQHSFVDYLATAAVNEAWGNMYNPASGLVAAFAAYWREVATAFADSEYVLGYELVNEPWGGNVLADPFRLGPQVDMSHLLPFYKTVVAAIREVDSNHIVLFEPVVSDGWFFVTPGFTASPEGPAHNNKQALAYHLYCASVNSSGNVAPHGAGKCDGHITKYMDLSLGVARKLGVGAFMTEFGAVGETSPSLGMMTTMLAAAEHNLQSWAYWTLKSYRDITTVNDVSESIYLPSGAVQQPKVNALARSYAKAVAGVPSSIRMAFQEGSPSSPTSFTLAYTPLPTTAQSPTLLSLYTQQHYPRGFTLTTQPASVAVTWQFRAASNTVAVFHPSPPALPRSGADAPAVTLTITVTAK